MLLYLYLMGASFLRDCMRPALGDAWRQRSFAPCRDLCAGVVARSAQTPPDDCVVRQVARGLSFAREFWQRLVGELLVFACEDMPLVQTAPATLCCLLAPKEFGIGDVPRSEFAPIQQVHYGSRDLRIGGAFYRPDHAGYNAEDDVARLLRYLDGIDPSAWHESMLCPMVEFASRDEREEELAFVRDWWPALVEIYRSALIEHQVIVCECV
jgi:hypothetical protein